MAPQQVLLPAWGWAFINGFLADRIAIKRFLGIPASNGGSMTGLRSGITLHGVHPSQFMLLTLRSLSPGVTLEAELRFESGHRWFP
jgi:hypothetical protein